MKRKQRDAGELEAELLRLNELVRARRKQLARLEQCPNKDCECRLVWREVTEQNLAGQVSRVRRGVRDNGPAKTAKAKKPARGSKRG
jgi:hypothetical protein